MMLDITSVSYILFVAVSLLFYWNVKKEYQWWILLADSLIFFFLNAKPHTFLYLLMSVAGVYLATAFFESEASPGQKKTALVGALIINFGLLVLLKYTNLFLGTYRYFTKRDIPLVNWYAPLGISFYTLQITAYLLDCYWGVAKRERNPLKLLLFTGFFPLMISGPISMHSQLSPQLFAEHRFDYEKVTRGVRRMAWGFAKKLVVANRLAVVVAYLFGDPDLFSGLWVWVAALLFITQLYFDFSGCMDIVIGVSLCFGIEVTENFRAPFLSKSIQEFWQRWHITLGGWLKAYVMYPLLKTDGLVALGSKCKKRFGKPGKKIPSYIAMFFVWFLMGLWHGNSWKYVLGEGLWFWFILVLSQVLEPAFGKWKKAFRIEDTHPLWKAFQIGRTLLLYSFGMIFFRAQDLPSALYMVGRMFAPTLLRDPLGALYRGAWPNMGGKFALLAIMLIGGLQFVADLRTYRQEDTQELIQKLHPVLRWGAYLGLVALIVLEGAFGQSSFIYFGF